jgi:hypothetical protein
MCYGRRIDASGERFLLPRRHSLIVAAAAVAASALSPVGEDGQLKTREYLDLPEIFQESVIAGSMSVLRHFAAGSDDFECFAQWSAAGDVVAIVSTYAQTHPDSLDHAFARTLLDALLQRCQPAG